MTTDRRARVDAPPALLKPVPSRAEAPGPVPARYAKRTLIVAYVAMSLISVGMLYVIGRVVQLQTQPEARIVQLVGSQQSTTLLPGRRGALVDRRGRIIAATSVAHRLFVDPFLIQEPVSFSERVGYTLGYDPVDLERKLSTRLNRRFVAIDDRLDEARLAKLEDFHISGLAQQRWLERQYPHGPLAGQVVGFVGFEGRGLEGAELMFDRELTGHDGRIGYLRDARRRPLWVGRDAYKRPADGGAVRLSLDLTIQFIAEAELAAACRQFGAQSGQMLVMQPFTGEILAMANYPTFDINDLSTSTAEQRRNRCITDVFEPGSTFKPFVWAAASQWGFAKPDEIIECGPGYYVSPQGRRLRDAHGHGRITWDQVLVKSSNIGMAIVGQRMGAQRMHSAVRAFGFGSTTGSGLPGESPGILNPLRQWTHYSVTSVPMGQEIAVTSLQITNAFCAIVNDGLLTSPTIVAQDPDEPLASAPIYERVLSASSATHTRQVLRRVVTEGTGRKANSPAYAIFGKTGTAQVPDRKHGGYFQDQYVSGFIGAAPYEQPRIVVSCYIHRPDKRKGHYGGLVAAPAVRRVIEQTLVYLGVPPTPDEHLSRQAILARH